MCVCVCDYKFITNDIDLANIDTFKIITLYNIYSCQLNERKINK